MSTIQSIITGPKNSLITCYNSQGGKILATPVNIKRHEVYFEVYNPYSIVQLSEVLSDFRIVVGSDRTVYSGKSVVIELNQIGTITVCRSSLSEKSWLDVDLFSPTGQRECLQRDFEAFLSESQKIRRVTPEFKLVVADMHFILTDLSHWLAQVESGIRTIPIGDREQLERQVMDDLSGPVMPILNDVFGQLESVSRNLDPASHAMHCAYIKRQLHPLVLDSPFASRTFHKPLGYAGDYEMVNMILGDSVDGSSLFAKAVNHYFLNSGPALAHRNRIQYLTELLRVEGQRVAAAGRPLRVLNLGCGPAGEIQNLLKKEKDLVNQMDITLLDFNDETLQFVRERIESLKAQYHRETRIRFLKKSVHQLLREKTRISPEQSTYDLIYCAGLFDYLSNRICQRLMNIFYEMVAPGGLLVATNVDPSNPARYGMEFILEWHLNHRDSQQMKLLHPTGVAPGNIVTKSDDTGFNIYLEVRRSPAR